MPDKLEFSTNITYDHTKEGSDESPCAECSFAFTEYCKVPGSFITTYSCVLRMIYGSLFKCPKGGGVTLTLEFEDRNVELEE